MERRSIAVHGIVQGVGFRPFVYGLASRHLLGGFVRNDGGGVTIEVEGETEPLENFLAELVKDSPPLAKIEDVSWERHLPRGERQFRIEVSDERYVDEVGVAPDAATCDDCLAELFDPTNRRYLYPFINCTNCGPRLTIINGWPYDRAKTTMARFEMCDQCRAEYENPSDRRFHAQPIACPKCGPRVEALDGAGQLIESGNPIELVAEALSAGKIAAIKGLGGYHLACDARNADAVAELRRRKHRDEKPFAVMVENVEAAMRLCRIGEGERQLLTSTARPIVLMEKRESNGIDQKVAPGNPRLGVMLAYTPLHHVLLRQMKGAALVMTSGNRSDEPIAIDEADALQRLGEIADIYLVHGRAIHVRCDDSVTRVIGAAESPVRRSRGYAPATIALPVECGENVLAVGGQLKATFALGSGRRAVMSHHMGDLDDLKAYRAFEKDVALYEELFAIKPAWIAHDLHPDYASTHYALRREADDGIPRIAVQHHHAHMASCMAENNLATNVIGVSFDGTGFGTDGAIWGGEFLVGDYLSFKRAGHFRYVAMPGGERAVKQPWRMAAAHLANAGVACSAFEKRMPAAALQTVRTMIDRKFNSPMTSSAGRLFDAVAAMIGLRSEVSYEGQAAMELEWAFSPSPCTQGEGRGEGPSASAAISPNERNPHPNPLPGYRERGHEQKSAEAGEYPFEFLTEGGPMIVDTRPLIAAIASDVDRGVDGATIAKRFHWTMASTIVAVCLQIRKTDGLDQVVLSGGVFMNAMLTMETTRRLEAQGFKVFRHRLVPPNDGGLSLGQLAVAARTIAASR